jgi:hypothetical protein
LQKSEIGMLNSKWERDTTCLVRQFESETNIASLKYFILFNMLLFFSCVYSIKCDYSLEEKYWPQYIIVELVKTTLIEIIFNK